MAPLAGQRQENIPQEIRLNDAKHTLHRLVSRAPQLLGGHVSDDHRKQFHPIPQRGSRSSGKLKAQVGNDKQKWEKELVSMRWPLLSLGEQNVFLITLAATAGALLGAVINYVLARWLGRPLVYRFANSRLGHVLLVDEAKVERAEKYFDDHGAIGTLIGRLVPVVRQLISIPAGLARMSLGRFVLYTTLGAGLWNTILAAMGYYIGRNFSGQLDEKVAEYSGELKIAMLGLGILVVLYLAYKGFKK